MLTTLNSFGNRSVPLRGSKTPIPTFRGVDPPSLQDIVRQFPREHGVLVYCGYNPIPGDPGFNLAKRLGKAIGNTIKDNRRLFVVTGGGERTTNMGAVAEGAIAAGSTALGVAIPFPGWTPPENDHSCMVLHPNFALRLYGEAGFEHCSAYTVALPGGVGTTHEILAKAQDLYFNHTPFPAQRQVVLVDHNNYFTRPNGLIPYLQGMVDDGMLNPGFMDLFKIVKTPEEVPEALLSPDILWTQPMSEEPAVVEHRKLNYFG